MPMERRHVGPERSWVAAVGAVLGARGKRAHAAGEMMGKRT
jgi:hypothetical protein